MTKSFPFQCNECGGNLYFREDKLVADKHYWIIRACTDCGKAVKDSYVYKESKPYTQEEPDDEPLLL